VLEDACEALAGWLHATPQRPLHVAVNVSASQLSNVDLPDMVRSVIGKAGVPAAYVCLEVTESALVAGEAAIAMLHTLREIGVEIAIDDFGTGYSSLSRLHLFPIDYVKIDSTFVAEMSTSGAGAAVVAAVLGLAANLGFRTVAEGIEEQSQLDQLTALGCDFGQGFLWSRALPVEAATLLLRSVDHVADLLA
jgi:EAL domain-containing protein (putative c-di-GMP-specific phosphodiesterase class I)